MASSQQTAVLPLTDSRQKNRRFIKGIGTGSRGSSDDDSSTFVAESSRRGNLGQRLVSDSEIRSSSPSLDAEKEKTERRLSKVVPKRGGREIAHEEKPWEAKNILSCDGGGVRGLYSLLMLKQLMDQVKYFEEEYVDGEGVSSPAKSSFHPLEQPSNVSHKLSSLHNNEDEQRASGGVFLPCHYFDYICGTSTGGLIAIMLGRLRMSVDDCIQEYEQLAGSIFGHANFFPQTFLPTAWMKRPKYDTQVLESVLQGVTARRGEVSTDQGRRTLKTGTKLCRVFVFAWKRDGHDNNRKKGPAVETLYIFRSYDRYKKSNSIFLRNPGRASDYALWQVARATSAAPFYFAPMKVFHDDEIVPPKISLIKRVTSTFKAQAPPSTTGQPVTFTDGGYGPANNPSKEAWIEVTSSNEKVGTFVSVGTGRENPSRFHTGLRRFIRAGIATIGDPEPTHNEMQDKEREHKFSYFRFNEVNGLPDLDFDEWNPSKTGRQTRDKIQRSFGQWIAAPGVQESFRKCASELVRRRRLRTADESEWERYAVKTYFDCGEDKCPGEVGKRWYNGSEFRDHLLTDHSLPRDGSSLDNAIRRDRRTWRYKAPENGGTVYI